MKKMGYLPVYSLSPSPYKRNQTDILLSKSRKYYNIFVLSSCLPARHWRLAKYSNHLMGMACSLSPNMEPSATPDRLMFTGTWPAIINTPHHRPKRNQREENDFHSAGSRHSLWNPSGKLQADSLLIMTNLFKDFYSTGLRSK